MRPFSLRTLSLAAMASLLSAHSFALESQYLSQAENLPVEFRQVISCGQWSEGNSNGHFRVVLVDVSGGAGSEVYVQRVRDPSGNSESLQLLDTASVPELNDDHAQYQISSVACKRKGRLYIIELLATFEHDEANVEHLITIQLDSKRLYRVTNTSRRTRFAQ